MNLDHATVMYERRGYCHDDWCDCRHEGRPHIVQMQALPGEPAWYDLDRRDKWQKTPFHLEWVEGWMPA